MNEKKLISDLKIWLEKDNNSKAKLAVKLGYKSSAAIQMWLLRDSIPDWQIERVEKIIKSKGGK